MCKDPKRNWLDLCGYLLGAGLVTAFGFQAIAQYQAQQPQRLPTTALLEVENTVIALEVAITEQQQAIGLMHRQTLQPNQGMLFPVEPPRQVETWMHNVKFDLDILFVLDGKIQAIAFAAPCQIQRCPRYRSPKAVDQVIELAGGQVQKLGLRVGDRVSIHPLTTYETSSP